jgi:hypothetical protein
MGLEQWWRCEHRQFANLLAGCFGARAAPSSQAGQVPMVWNLDKRGDLGVKRVKEGGDASIANLHHTCQLVVLKDKTRQVRKLTKLCWNRS